ncbi:MAG: hypothetical protein JNM56_28455 [Planctomycetia bacterium]|nr:hypothetical protein [Planctomycetia bacterium]
MSTSPVPPKADKTALYIALGIGGGFLFLCVAPAILIVVCLAAIQMLGQNSSTLFQTVAASIGTTTSDGPSDPREQAKAREQVDDFCRALLEQRYDDASNLGSADFLLRGSPDNLRRLWEDQPVLRRRDRLTYTIVPSGAGSGTRHTFLVTWKDRGGREVRMTVEMTRSILDEWEVSRCTTH